MTGKISEMAAIGSLTATDLMEVSEDSISSPTTWSTKSVTISKLGNGIRWLHQGTAAAAMGTTELVLLSQESSTVTITATTISAAAADNSYNDSGSGFVTAGFAVGDAVTVRGFTGDTANNITSGVITSLSAGKMIIGGTDGDVIVDDAAGESVTISKWVPVRKVVDDLLHFSSAGTASSATVIEGTDNSNAMLRITQLGTGDALVVEDASTPDSTPFAIKADGALLIGHNAQLTSPNAQNESQVTLKNQIHGISNTQSALLMTQFNAAAQGAAPGLMFARAWDASLAGMTAVRDGDKLGSIKFTGADGTNFISAAGLYAEADGTISTGIVPGELVFRTATSAGTLTEGLRLKSTQEVRVTANNSTSALTINQVGTGNAFVVEDAATPDSTPFAIDATGVAIQGTTASYTVANVQNGNSQVTPLFQQHGTATQQANVASTLWSATTAVGSALVLSKSANASIGSHTAVANGDVLGHVVYEGSDGTEFRRAAEVRATADGTISTGIVPGQIQARTSNASGTMTTAMVIDSKQNVVIGTAQLADSATDGYLYIPGTTSGAPSGSPTAYSGRHPMVYDDTNSRLFVHNGTAWRGVVSNESMVIACSDETTALTTGTAKVTFRMPYAFTLTAVRASLTTAQATGSTLTIDINESGASILGTKLTIDNTEKTSTTAAAAATITDSSLADDAEMTVDIDTVGDGTATGLKIYLIGYRP